MKFLFELEFIFFLILIFNIFLILKKTGIFKINIVFFKI